MHHFWSHRGDSVGVEGTWRVEVGFCGDMGDPMDEVSMVVAGVKRFALHVDLDRT